MNSLNLVHLNSFLRIVYCETLSRKFMIRSFTHIFVHVAVAFGVIEKYCELDLREVDFSFHEDSPTKVKDMAEMTSDDHEITSTVFPIGYLKGSGILGNGK